MSETKPKAHSRLNTGLFAAFERRVLPRMAAQLPSWVTPDQLTSLGIFSSFVIGIGYYLTSMSLSWLWLCNAMLIVHWAGDSLDGTLARVRQIQREKYGFFVDHLSDMVSVLFICGGMGLSPIMDFRVALMLIIGYFMMMGLVNLITISRGVFRLSFGGFGPTEVRVLIFAANTFVWAAHNPAIQVAGAEYTLFTAFGFVIACIMGVTFFISAEIERRKLAVLDPTPHRKSQPSAQTMRADRVLIER
jgi:phosphatidylglycerophosphate synthase